MCHTVNTYLSTISSLKGVFWSKSYYLNNSYDGHDYFYFFYILCNSTIDNTLHIETFSATIGVNLPLLTQSNNAGIISSLTATAHSTVDM
jgi:hypothetical protein